MGFLNDILGRSAPKRADLDSLFRIPDAAITLRTSMGLIPTGDGAVCYRRAEGAAFATTQDDVVALIRARGAGPEVRVTDDAYGFTWLEVDHDPLDPDDASAADLSELCADLHAVNTSLEEAGFGPGLLCSLVPFEVPGGGRLGLVYLYKQSTFYPFAPRRGGSQERDNLVELQVRDAIAGDLPVEKDLGRWLAVWGAPGL